MRGWRDDMRALEASDRHPIQPQYLVSLINRYAGGNTELRCCDVERAGSGSACE